MESIHRACRKRLSPSNPCSKCEKCNYENNAFKDKLKELNEVSGYVIESCHSKYILNIHLKFNNSIFKEK